MIEIRCRPDSGDFVLAVRGHTRTDVCAAVSAVVQAAALGCKAIAKAHPEHVRFTEVERAPPPEGG